ncbi:MAG: phosphate-starvation-inducible PsiE family protein [Clostridiales bacterium]|nr:phosphate-starvation-inducible PsiE family protein [Clostridiales bacterium]
MRKKIQEKMFEFGYILELIISCVVGFAVVVLGVRLFMHTFDVTIFGSDENALVGILDGAMNLAIGVEFIKMLCRHTPETVIEVLLFAIARQLVVVHTSPIDNLITIVSVAVLFAVRKFLLRDDDNLDGFDRFFRRNKSIKKENSEENRNSEEDRNKNEI